MNRPLEKRWLHTLVRKTRPLKALALLAVGFSVGTALTPASAQQTASADNQVAVRSDGAVYVLANGVRRWVATVVISDEELNAIPEGEPIYTGLGPAGGAAAAPAANPAAAAAPAAAAPPAAPTATATPTRTPEPELTLKINSIDSVRQGRSVKIVAETSLRKKGQCDLELEFDDGDTQDEGDKEPDSDGKCSWDVDLDDDVEPGDTKARVTVRDGDKRKTESRTFEVRKR